MSRAVDASGASSSPAAARAASRRHASPRSPATTSSSTRHRRDRRAAADRGRRADPRRAARLRRLPRARASAASGSKSGLGPRRRGTRRARRCAGSHRLRGRGDARSRRLPASAAGRGSSYVWELLGGRGRRLPARAVVVDDGTGFWHGISAAEYLAEHGAAVELLTPARGVGLTIPHESIGNVSRRLARHGVRVRVLAKVTGVDGTTVSFAEGFARRPRRDDRGSRRRPHEDARERRADPRARRRRPCACDDRRRFGPAPPEPRGPRRQPRDRALRRGPARAAATALA